MISMSMFTFDAMAATLEVYFINIQDILSFPLLASASVVVPFDIVRRILKLFALLSPFSTRKTFVFAQCRVNKFAWWETGFKPTINSYCLEFSGVFLLYGWSFAIPISRQKTK